MFSSSYLYLFLWLAPFQEELVLKNNENGTWTMGKKERTSTFKLNEDWDENWGQVTAKNNVEGKISLIWQITNLPGFWNKKT